MKSLPELDQVLMADVLVKKMGEKLIGRTVITPSWRAPFGGGGYPGGKAIVTQIAPDPSAPKIVFEVLHPTFGVWGVFENEEVLLCNDIEYGDADLQSRKV